MPKKLIIGFVVLVVLIPIGFFVLSTSELDKCIDSGLRAHGSNYRSTILKEYGQGETAEETRHRIRMECSKVLKR
jgi:hypothetical protein